MSYLEFTVLLYLIISYIFASVNEDVDLEYAMIDGTIVKVHRHGQGAKGGPSNSL